MFKKIAALATAAVLCAGLMAGCGASSTCLLYTSDAADE